VYATRHCHSTHARVSSYMSIHTTAAACTAATAVVSIYRQADEVAAQQRQWKHVPAVVTPTPVTTSAAAAVADASTTAADDTATAAATAAATDTSGPPPAVKAARAVIDQVRKETVSKAVAQPFSLARYRAQSALRATQHAIAADAVVLMLLCCCYCCCCY
jgi:hypothetical protein